MIRISVVLLLAAVALCGSVVAPAAAQSVVALSDDGTLRMLEDPNCEPADCRWQDIDRNSRTVALAATPVDIFQIWDSGPIWRWLDRPCDPGGCPHWSLLDNNSASRQITANRRGLFQLHAGGSIWRWLGEPCEGGRCRSWEPLDRNPRSTAIAAGGDELFQLHRDGSIWQWQGGACEDGACESWRKLDQNPAARQIVVGGNGALFQRHDNGSIWRWDGHPCVGQGDRQRCLAWTRVDNNPATVSIHASAGELYQRHRNGSVFRWKGRPCDPAGGCPHWERLDNNAATRDLAAGRGPGSRVTGTPDRPLFQAHAGGAVWRWDGRPCEGGSCPHWQRVTGSGAFTGLSGERVGLYYFDGRLGEAPPLIPASAASGDDIWRLSIEEIRVAQARESGGDRPYFSIIQFQSRFSSRRSTEVSVISHEPHDWVSKSNLRGRLPAGGDHMFAGELTEPPFWHKTLEWRDLRVLPAPPAGRVSPGDIDPRLVNLPIVGAVILMFDNNNTPPHNVRNLSVRLAEKIEEVLDEEVARSNVLAALRPDFRRGLERRIEALAEDLFSDAEIAELALQMTVGSTFNPDKLIGLQVVMLPALDSFPVSESTRLLPNLPLITDGRVPARTLVRSLQPWEETLAFSGSGADYLVRVDLDRVACTDGGPIESLSVSMLSGDDGLRDNSTLTLELDRGPGRSALSVNLGRGDGDSRHSAFVRTARLPEAMPRAQLRGLRLRQDSGGSPTQGRDNWTLNALEVRAGDTVLASRSGQPLHRFTGQQPVLELSLACGGG